MSKLWLIGNKTEWSPIRSAIILVIKQIGLPLHGRPILLNTRMITDRIGLTYLFIYLFIYLFNRFHHDYNTKKDIYILTRHKKPRTKMQDTQ